MAVNGKLWTAHWFKLLCPMKSGRFSTSQCFRKSLFWHHVYTGEITLVNKMHLTLQIEMLFAQKKYCKLISEFVEKAIDYKLSLSQMGQGFLAVCVCMCHDDRRGSAWQYSWCWAPDIWGPYRASGFVHPMDQFNSPSTLADVLQNESDVIARVW